MPEGHTIHRASRLHARRFSGHVLRVWSPQGRFDEGAALLDGSTLESVDAWGKHLFYRWDDGRVLHVHLGLFGKFRLHREDPPPPTDGTRLAWEGAPGRLYLSGPTDCRVIDPDEEAAIVGGLGPDPLRRSTHDGAVDHMAGSLRRRSIPIGQALLDQSLVCGIGNVYRAEIPFRLGIDPRVPSKDITVDDVGRIWRESVDQLRAGERSGRIVTTDPSDVGRRRRSDIRAGERTYVYKRAGRPCRRCGTGIRRTELAGRKVWWCPECQTGG